MIDRMVLALLLPGPRHGYELKREVGAALGRGPLHNNTIYPLLQKFARAGWVRVRVAPGQRGQTRRLYTLSASGRDALRAQLRLFSARQAESESEFQLRVGLFDLLSPPDRERILAARERVLEARQERLEAIRRHFGLDHGYAAAVVEFRLRAAQSEQQWIESLKAQAGGRSTHTKEKPA